MWLVQIFLPLAAGSDEALRQTKEELTRRFGGLTAYSRAPAEGIWQDGGEKEEDDIVIIEVMTADLDRKWWRQFRTRLEHELDQDEVIVRAQTIEKL